MFRLIRQINDVYDPVISGMEIIYTDSNKALIKTGENFYTVENNLSSPFALLGITGNEIIVLTNDAIVSLDANNTVNEIYPLPAARNTQIELFYDNHLMIIRNNVQQEWRLCKYDFRRSQIIWEREAHYRTRQVFKFKTYLIATYFENNDLLRCFSEIDGALLWQLHINELGVPGAGYEIFNEPGIYKNLLLVNIRQRFNLFVIGLDIDTGQLRWYRQGTGLRFQVEEDKLLCFSGNYILQIDPATGTILHAVSIQDKIATAGIDPYGNVVFKGQLMYLAGILDTIISVWDINTGALLWQHRLYGKSLTGRRGISIPASENILQVQDNRIYVLDSERVLHVFEKI